MAVRLRRDIFNTPTIEVPLDGSTNLANGELVYADKTNGVAKACTASVGDATNLIGVVVGDPAATATACSVIPIIGNEGQLWEIDCTNNTASNQLLKNHLLTDSLNLNNTNTTSADINAAFVAVAIVGAAADKKLLGYFAKVGHVTA